ncbi:MarR family winged helix-turn-helix transcriptional regulator [Caenimonas terrae]|uniref:MarR family winged helix-turn-helix transcriptional regulator n=1 Tax=Caenimonas terrae TaxID=696074 RepID=A0ABW0NAL1_9BURK
MSITEAAVRLRHPQGLPDMLLYRLNRIRAVGGGMVLRYCEGQFGVTRREWVVIALLAAGGATTSSELAARAELDKSATSKAIVSLVKKGLVTRLPRPGDRRYIELALTAGGNDLYRQILPVVQEVNRDLMSGLTDAEIAVLDRLLERVGQRAGEMAGSALSLPRADRRRGGSARRAAPAA